MILSALQIQRARLRQLWRASVLLSVVLALIVDVRDMSNINDVNDMNILNIRYIGYVDIIC